VGKGDDVTCFKEPKHHQARLRAQQSIELSYLCHFSYRAAEKGYLSGYYYWHGVCGKMVYMAFLVCGLL
jgi:hypothetical protein